MLPKGDRVSEENEMSNVQRHTKETMSKSERCDKCNGTGYVRKSEIHCPKCNVKGEQDRVYKSQYRCVNSNCSVIEFVDDYLELNITIDSKEWEDEPLTEHLNREGKN